MEQFITVAVSFGTVFIESIFLLNSFFCSSFFIEQLLTEPIILFLQKKPLVVFIINTKSLYISSIISYVPRNFHPIYRGKITLTSYVPRNFLERLCIQKTKKMYSENPEMTVRLFDKISVFSVITKINIPIKILTIKLNNVIILSSD